MNTFEVIDRFTSFTVNEFSRNTAAVVLTGSFAKNDFTEKSDIDIWLVLNSVSEIELNAIAEYCKSSGNTKLNVQCVSSGELLNKPFKKAFSPVQLYIDGITKYGALPAYIPYNSEVRTYAAAIAAEVMMSSRHYITTGENEASLAAGRLLKWVLKPLSWVYRYKIYLKDSAYPRSFNELYSSLDNNEDREFIQQYEMVLKKVFKGSLTELNKKCHNLAIKNSII